MKVASVLSLGLVLLTLACKKEPERKVYFGNLVDGAEVQSPFVVEMKAENLIVEPATLGINDGHGHFHIIIDNPLPATKSPIPKNEQHIHYGGGQTQDTLDLPMGEHSLILQFATGDHIPYDPQIKQEIHIKVTSRLEPAPADSTLDSLTMAP